MSQQLACLNYTLNMTKDRMFYLASESDIFNPDNVLYLNCLDFDIALITEIHCFMQILARPTEEFPDLTRANTSRRSFAVAHNAGIGIY